MNTAVGGRAFSRGTTKRGRWHCSTEAVKAADLRRLGKTSPRRMDSAASGLQDGGRFLAGEGNRSPRRIARCGRLTKRYDRFHRRWSGRTGTVCQTKYWATKSSWLVTTTVCANTKILKRGVKRHVTPSRRFQPDGFCMGRNSGCNQNGERRWLYCCASHRSGVKLKTLPCGLAV